jgi:hypothetical protein
MAEAGDVKPDLAKEPITLRVKVRAASPTCTLIVSCVGRRRARRAGDFCGISLQDSAGVETVFKVKKSTKFKRILEVRLGSDGLAGTSPWAAAMPLMVQGWAKTIAAEMVFKH